MASKKNLKKVIGYISSELLSQAIFVSLNSERNIEEWNTIFTRILVMNNDYFNALCTSFNNEAKEIVADIQKG